MPVTQPPRDGREGAYSLPQPCLGEAPCPSSLALLHLCRAHSPTALPPPPASCDVQRGPQCLARPGLRARQRLGLGQPPAASGAAADGGGALDRRSGTLLRHAASSFAKTSAAVGGANAADGKATSPGARLTAANLPAQRAASRHPLPEPSLGARSNDGSYASGKPAAPSTEAGGLGDSGAAVGLLQGLWRKLVEAVWGRPKERLIKVRAAGGGCFDS